MSELSEKLRNSKLLTESALKVSRSYSRRETARKAPRLLGKAIYAALTGTIITTAIFQSGEAEQFKAITEAFEFQDILSKALGGNVREYIDSLWETLMENGGGYCKYASWQFVLTQAKGVWDNMSDGVLGAYSNGEIKLNGGVVVPSSVVMAAYARLGVPFRLNGDKRDYDAVAEDISELANHVNLMDKIEVAHFMRATGIIPSDIYTQCLTSSIKEKVMEGKMDAISSSVAMFVSGSSIDCAVSIVNMFNIDNKLRRSLPIIDKFADNLVFSSDENLKIKFFLEQAGIIDNGGICGGTKNNEISMAHTSVNEHILSVIESGDAKLINELRALLVVIGSALSKVGLGSEEEISEVRFNQEEDNLKKIFGKLSKKSLLVDSVGVVSLGKILEINRNIAQNITSLSDAASPVRMRNFQ